MDEDAFKTYMHDLLVNGDKEEADDAFRDYLDVDEAHGHLAVQRDRLLAVVELMERPGTWGDPDDERKACMLALAIRRAIGA
ncbi:hypothetical protein H6A18_09450 [Collinsella tanakaei]|uniref:hypothetical protein n=1 Tax=Collinsella tanakaei TaxID=626935 RepID=UPI00195AF6A9|nr:hypothetical protein [Collinsella tanakaei]MBM6756726.1 hypothetical protein [Collinsella tanakaei]